MTSEYQVSAHQVSEQQFVVFEVNRESYGIEIGRVQEIDRMEKITAVPQLPSFVEGIINLRGKVTPVVNLRARLGLPEGEITAQSRIVVVMAQDAWIGLIVDSVSQVQRIPSSAVEAAPATVAGTEAGVLRGIAKLDDRLVILLDLDVLLRDVAGTALPAPVAAYMT